MAFALTSEDEENIELWKVRKLIKTLEEFEGNGTSMISIYLPQKGQISPLAKKLTDELGAAQNIKSRVNRQSVITAITSVQSKLKLYNKVPPNGLVIFCGEISTDDGKEKKQLLTDDTKFGFIIVDGKSALYGTLHGNVREVMVKFSVDLPKKHGRGGQSALRFSRLRLEKRHNYLRKVAEAAVQCFITNDRVNVAGLVLAGSADFKTELSQSDMFDSRLQAKVLQIVDVSYGSENGFNQAIELSAGSLGNLKFIKEKKLLDDYFSEIYKDSGLFSFGVEDTFKALECGAVETLIVWENLDIIRYEFSSPDRPNKIVHLRQNQANTKINQSEDGVKYELAEQISLIEWLVDNYKNYGCKLEIVTDKTQEGSQFCKGFGGFGAQLRYKMEFDDDFSQSITDDNYDDDNDYF